MDIFDAYLAEMRLLQRKPQTITTYRRIVSQFRDSLTVPPAEATREDVRNFLLSSGWAPSSQRLALAWLRAAYNHAVDELELIEKSPCRRIKLPAMPQKVVRTIPNRVLREVKAGIRSEADHLLFCVYCYAGLRNIEVGRLTWNDVIFSENVLHVHGKRDKYRLVPIHPELRKSLRRAKMISPWVFGSSSGPIARSTLHARMKRLADGRDIRNHDYRRTFASSLRANRVDPYVRDAIMGWTKEEQFAQAYNAVSARELQDAILLAYADDPV